LSRVIGEIAGVDLRGIVFFYPEYSPEARPGSMWQWRTKFGPMFVAVTGYAPSWSDIPYALRNSMTSLAVNLAAVFSMSVVVAWLVVRDGLAPLRSAAAAAERLDFDSIGQGVAAEGAPSEVAPLIDAVNGALKRLDAAATRMRRYTANAAHELRTPVAILRARLENPEERSFKADLERDARRIQGIVEQMLIAARLTERQATLDDRIDLVAAIRSTVADYSPLVYRTKRRIELEAPETPTIIRGNRRALDSIIANLIDNALQAEPAGGMVVVRVTEAAVVEVVDHGAGVPEDARELIFEPFWRKTDTRAGAGLGLAIVKELVELLGGRIAVTATKGGGATFRLTFPQVADPSAAEEGANIC
jgi:signal transduction histidine kinase